MGQLFPGEDAKGGSFLPALYNGVRGTRQLNILPERQDGRSASACKNSKRGVFEASIQGISHQSIILPGFRETGRADYDLEIQIGLLAAQGEAASRFRAACNNQ